SRGSDEKHQLSDRQIAPPGGANQLRARRPRPAVWYSAVRKSNSPAGGASRCRRSVLVEPVRQTHWPVRSRLAGARGHSFTVRSRSRSPVAAGKREPRFGTACTLTPTARSAAMAFQIALRLTRQSAASLVPE